MRSRTVVALVLGTTITATTGADDATVPTAPWSTGLPRVEATTTEVGPAQYLWGSTLLLAVPDKFQGYWPDYGYRWSNAAYIELCGGASKSNEGESASLGRVRLVAESGDEGERLIGVQLRHQGEESDEVAERTSEPQEADTGFTVEQLCALFGDDAGRQRVESMVRLMAGTRINLLTTGKWHRKTFAVNEDPDLEASEYMLLWMGSGVHEGVDIANKVSWSAKGKPVVIWNYPSVVKLHKGYDKGASGVIAFHEEPGYMLTKTWGAMDVAAIDQPMSFQVSKGVVDASFLGNKKFQGPDIEIGILRVWADVAKFQEIISPMELKLWLVTENAIPTESLVPEIRVGENK